MQIIGHVDFHMSWGIWICTGHEACGYAQVMRHADMDRRICMRICIGLWACGHGQATMHSAITEYGCGYTLGYALADISSGSTPDTKDHSCPEHRYRHYSDLESWDHTWIILGLFLFYNSEGGLILRIIRLLCPDRELSRREGE